MVQGGGIPRRLVWMGLVVVTVGLGVWGFAVMPQRVAPAPLDVLYRTARLFTLNLDVEPGTAPPWQLWVAAVLAPLLLARGVAELFRERLQGALAQFLVRPEVVVLGAGYRAGTLAEAAQFPLNGPGARSREGGAAGAAARLRQLPRRLHSRAAGTDDGCVGGGPGGRGRLPALLPTGGTRS
jgi:hypothetical protein